MCVDDRGSTIVVYKVRAAKWCSWREDKAAAGRSGLVRCEMTSPRSSAGSTGSGESMGNETMDSLK